MPKSKRKIKIGNKVTWECKPYQRNSFIAEGIVKELGKSTFGSKEQNIAVKIEPSGQYREIFPNRGTTTVSLKNIINIITIEEID